MSPDDIISWRRKECEQLAFGHHLPEIRNILKMMSVHQAMFWFTLLEAKKSSESRRHQYDEDNPEMTRTIPEEWFMCQVSLLKEFGWDPPAQAKYLQFFKAKGWIEVRRTQSVPSIRIVKIRKEKVVRDFYNLRVKLGYYLKLGYYPNPKKKENKDG